MEMDAHLNALYKMVFNVQKIPVEHHFANCNKIFASIYQKFKKTMIIQPFLPFEQLKNL
jgi:hypothetical protein